MCAASQVSGAAPAKKRHSFKSDWEAEFWCTATDAGKALCLVCFKEFVLKKYNIERHYKTFHAATHANLSAEQKSDDVARLKANLEAELQSRKCQEATDKLSSADVVAVSYHVALKLAQTGKPHSHGSFIKECMCLAAAILCPSEAAKFEAVSLSRWTVDRRVIEMADDLDEQLKEKCRNFIAFSIGLDESTDTSSISELVIYVRGVDANLEPTEEMLAVVPLKDTTTATDVVLAVIDRVDAHELVWACMFSAATDGAPVMIGGNTGVVVQLRQKVLSEGGPSIIGVHCILHRENLCAKVTRLEHVMDPLVKAVNFIRSYGGGLNHRQFHEFLKEMECEFGDIPFYTEVRWLSCGKVLKRFFDLRTEIDMFLDMKGKPMPQLSDARWVCDLGFLTDITQHLNDLNVRMQGRGHLITDLYDLIKGFVQKLKLWQGQLKEGNTAHFEHLATVVCDAEDEGMFAEYVGILVSLEGEFDKWFVELVDQDPMLNVFAAPFAADVAKAPADLQCELIDLQCDRVLRERYRMCDNLTDFYKLLPNIRFPKIRLMAARIICMFGTTYNCEQFFSKMKITKSKIQALMTDQNLQANMRVMSAQKLVPDINKLVRAKRAQVSRNANGSSSSSS